MIVVCPLNSIIEVQISYLDKKNILSAELKLEKSNDSDVPSLFEDTKEIKNKNAVPENIAKGRINILFSHPESLLCEEGRTLLLSKVYQENVVACSCL